MYVHDVHSVNIEEDEHGFRLVVESIGGAALYTFNLSGHEERLYDQVRGRIGPWLHERDEAKHRAIVFRCDPDESAGAYERRDPKHSQHHDVFSAVYDQEQDR